MPRLHVAMPQVGSAEAFRKWDEISAGAWTDYVTISFLSSGKTDRIANDGIVGDLARPSNATVYASQHLTSLSIAQARKNIQRYTKYKLLEAVEKWLDENNLDWRSRTKRYCESTPFTCITANEWVDQFAKVDPILGRRAGAALLAQFQVIGNAELGRYFSNLPDVDQSTYFFGADPQSGDFGLVNIIAAKMTNGSLVESSKLPKLKKDARVRIYCDGSWSGGETERRIRCLFTKCDKKSNALIKSQRLFVHVGFITDIAEKRIMRGLEPLIQRGVIQQGFVRITWPEGNHKLLSGVNSGQKGLAFHDMTLLKYVDDNPMALQELCRKIGDQLSPEKPLGTNEIASCIAFSHSLPAAMLPTFIVSGREVTGANGVKFTWKPLMESMHVLTGQDDDPDYHCTQCPLADRSPKGGPAEKPKGFSLFAWVQQFLRPKSHNQ
jgi:hypothetical protein